MRGDAEATHRAVQVRTEGGQHTGRCGTEVLWTCQRPRLPISPIRSEERAANSRLVLLYHPHSRNGILPPTLHVLQSTLVRSITTCVHLLEIAILRVYDLGGCSPRCASLSKELGLKRGHVCDLPDADRQGSRGHLTTAEVSSRCKRLRSRSVGARGRMSGVSAPGRAVAPRQERMCLQSGSLQYPARTTSPGSPRDRDVANHPVPLGHHHGVGGPMISADRSSHVPCVHVPLADRHPAVLADRQRSEPGRLAQGHPPIHIVEPSQMGRCEIEEDLHAPRTAGLGKPKDRAAFMAASSGPRGRATPCRPITAASRRRCQ